MSSDKDKKIQSVPKGYYTVTPYVAVKGAARFADFVKAAFDAKEEVRVPNPDDTIGHLELRIGGSVVMAFDSRENWPPTPSFLRLYVKDPDATYKQALQAGATSVTEPKTLMGERVGRVCDPFGNIWWIQSHVEDMAPDAWHTFAQDPEKVKIMRYMQDTLDEELSKRSK